MDGELHSLSNSCVRPWVDARREERRVAREQRAFNAGLERFRVDRVRVHLEEDIRVRAHLLEHLHTSLDGHRVGRRELRIGKGFGPYAEHDATCVGRGPAVGRERHAELPEANLVTLDHGVDEIHRRRPDERSDEEVLRRLVEPLRLVHLEDLAVAHDGNSLAERHRLHLVVGDIDRCHAEPRVQLGQRGAHRHAELRVEVGERLVHEERLGLPRDRAAHGYALSLAAGELRRPSLEHGLQAEQRGHLVDAPADLLLGRSAHLEAVPEVLPDRHVRVERVILEDHRDVSVAWREVRHVAPADRDDAVGHFLQAGDHSQQGRLAAARGADEHDELPIRNLQADVVDGDEVAREHLPDPVETDVGHAGLPAYSISSRSGIDHWAGLCID